MLGQSQNSCSTRCLDLAFAFSTSTLRTIASLIFICFDIIRIVSILTGFLFTVVPKVGMAAPAVVNRYYLFCTHGGFI